MNNFELPEPPRVVMDYCNYTTTHIITNKDMYSLDEIGNIVFAHEIKEDK